MSFYDDDIHECGRSTQDLHILIKSIVKISLMQINLDKLGHVTHTVVLYLLLSIITHIKTQNYLFPAADV